MATTDGINSTQSTSQAQTQQVTENPGANLDSQAFMKLLLTQLRYQDPTAPMDSEKMLSQTSQLATLETQENTNKIMTELAAQLQSQSENGMNNYAISAIGKLATIGDVFLAITEDTSATKFDVYFPDEIKEGSISIKDEKGNLIETIELESGKKGVLSFNWDGRDANGNRVPNGAYSVVANYTDTNNVTHEAKPGTYPVEGVKFEDGQAMLKLGSTYVPMVDIKEFQKGES